MKRIFYAFALLAMLVFTSPVIAGDSGIYFNFDRSGEGITLVRHDDTLQFSFFSFKPWQGCPGIDIPYYTLLTEENCHFSRWFISGADPIIGDNAVTGDLFIGLGFDYPDGIPDYGNPFGVLVGDGFKVGTYTLQRFQGGWRLAVTRYGAILDVDDPLYTTIYEFTTFLYPGDD